MSLRVTSAVYGPLRDGGQDNAEASIVKKALQERLNSTPNGVVTINNRNMGVDPAPGVRGQTGHGDVLAVLRIPVAFRTGALRHGLSVSRRSGDGCAPGTVHGTWVG